MCFWEGSHPVFPEQFKRVVWLIVTKTFLYLDGPRSPGSLWNHPRFLEEPEFHYSWTDVPKQGLGWVPARHWGREGKDRHLFKNKTRSLLFFTIYKIERRLEGWLPFKICYYDFAYNLNHWMAVTLAHKLCTPWTQWKSASTAELVCLWLTSLGHGRIQER